MRRHIWQSHGVFDIKGVWVSERQDISEPNHHCERAGFEDRGSLCRSTLWTCKLDVLDACNGDDFMTQRWGLTCYNLDFKLHIYMHVV